MQGDENMIILEVIGVFAIVIISSVFLAYWKGDEGEERDISAIEAYYAEKEEGN